MTIKKIHAYINSQGIELKQWSTYLFPSYHSYDSFLPEIENRAEDNARITRYANRYCKKVKPPTRTRESF